MHGSSFAEKLKLNDGNQRARIFAAKLLMALHLEFARTSFLALVEQSVAIVDSSDAERGTESLDL